MHNEKLKAELVYFKPSGKYYAGGCLEVDANTHLFDIWEEVERLNLVGGLPGLTEASTGWIIHVSVPGHPHDHPRLIIPEPTHESH